MAVPAYATDLTDILLEMPSSTGWTLISSGGGGASSFSVPETDDYIQGANCISRNPWSTSIRGMLYNTTQTFAADSALYIWWKADIAAALDTIANGGIQILIGSSTADYRGWYVAGSDTYQLGGWRCAVIDPTTTPSVTVGAPTATRSFFGVRWNVPSTGPSKGFPFKIDAFRRGFGSSVTAGEVADPATWAKVAAHDANGTRRWGVASPTATGADVQGTVTWGGSALVYSRDANRTIVFTNTFAFTSANFTQVVIGHASTDLEWDNISFTALGTTNRGRIVINNNAKAWLTNCTFTDINTTADGGTNTKFNGSTWRRCNAVTAAGGSFLDCNFLVPTVAVNTSALVWNLATDLGGLVNGSTFTKGTNAHHAIELGLTSPTTISLTDVFFTGFNVANGQNDSAIHVKRTTGTVTINISGGSSPSYRTDGATVVLVSSTTLTLTGLKNPTEVRVFSAGTTAAVAGSENVVSGTFSTGIDAATYPSVDIAVISLGFQNLRLLGVSTTSDVTIPVQQNIDRQYENP